MWRMTHNTLLSPFQTPEFTTEGELAPVLYRMSSQLLMASSRVGMPIKSESRTRHYELYRWQFASYHALNAAVDAMAGPPDPDYPLNPKAQILLNLTARLMDWESVGPGESLHLTYVPHGGANLE